MSTQTMAETVYVVALIQVEDWDTFNEDYLPTTAERIQANNGSVLVATDEAEELEGEWSCNWTVILEFPSEADANGFLEDDEYGEVVGVRHEAAEFSNIALLPGAE